ncbi:MAG: hypothetical protein KJ697_04210 [Nanoarchaeota archaeon]|nr:hypothetical protein [Nanoarchaeota archaeon]
MKGDVDWIYVLIVTVVCASVIISYFMFTNISDKSIKSTSYIYEDSERSDYSYPEFVSNSNDISDVTNYQEYFESEEFCKKLKEGIINSIVTGEPKTIDVVSYRSNKLNDYSIANIYPDLSKCDLELLKISLGPGVSQDVCLYDGRGTFMPTLDIAQYNGFDFNRCEFIADEVIKPENPSGFNYLTHMYKCNDYFHHIHYPSSWSEPGNGPGAIKVKIGKAVTDVNGDCKFTTLLCMQPYFADSETESIMNVFELFGILELYEIMIDNPPYYVKSETMVTADNIPVSTIFQEYLLPDISINNINKFVTQKKYTWGKQTIELDHGYHVRQMSDAIITGFDKNAAKYNWVPGNLWSIASMTAPVETPIDSNKNIYFDCGADSICSGKISIDIELTKIDLTIIGSMVNLDMSNFDTERVYPDPFLTANIKITEEAV